MTTRAPSSAKRFAVARPNPDAAPVTMPTWPSSRPLTPASCVRTKSSSAGSFVMRQ